ncbi:MAG: CPBP family intramembrane glutamic endopeptidase [Pseudobdellovibrionaceae bacterium]
MTHFLLMVSGTIQIAILGFTLMCVGAIVLRAWDLFYLSFTFLLLNLYWIVIPSFLSMAPVLPMLSVGFVATTVLFFVSKPELSWIRRGKMDTFSWCFLIATGVGSTAALIFWASWTDNLGAAKEMVQGFKDDPLWMAFVIIPVFALLNALAEEVIYRGIMQEVLSKRMRSQVLILSIQAAAFAAAHYAAGFPNGVVGYLMVFGYGIALGYLRYRTNGMLAPYIAHVIADLTIATFLVLRFL